jgi:hypothetical protein
VDGRVVSSDVVRAHKLNESLLHLLVFHAYINEMYGSRSKIPSQNLVRQRWAEGVKRLMQYNKQMQQDGPTAVVRTR